MGFRRTPTSWRGRTQSARTTLHAIRELCLLALSGDTDPVRTLREVERVAKRGRQR